MKTFLFFIFTFIAISLLADPEQEMQKDKEVKSSEGEKPNAVSEKNDDRLKAINKKLDSIIFDHVEFEDVSMPTAVKYSKTRSREIDPGKTGINIVLMNNALKPANNEWPVITIKVEDIPARQLLIKYCSATKLDMRIDPYSIVIGRNIPKYGSNPDPLSKGKFSEIMIEQIDFEEANIAATVKLLNELIRELDKTGINIVLSLVEEQVEAAPRITMNLDAIPAGEVIRYIALLADLKYDVKGDTVTLHK